MVVHLRKILKNQNRMNPGLYYSYPVDVMHGSIARWGAPGNLWKLLYMSCISSLFTVKVRNYYISKFAQFFFYLFSSQFVLFIYIFYYFANKTFCIKLYLKYAKLLLYFTKSTCITIFKRIYIIILCLPIMHVFFIFVYK